MTVISGVFSSMRTTGFFPKILTLNLQLLESQDIVCHVQCTVLLFPKQSPDVWHLSTRGVLSLAFFSFYSVTTYVCRHNLLVQSPVTSLLRVNMTPFLLKLSVFSLIGPLEAQTDFTLPALHQCCRLTSLNEASHSRMKNSMSKTVFIGLLHKCSIVCFNNAIPHYVEERFRLHFQQVLSDCHMSSI